MKVPRVELEIQRRDAFADGRTFGDVGPYEMLEGKAHVRYQPDCPSLAQVPDARLARRDGDGLITITSDFWLLRPVDQAKGNGALLFEFVNRGNKRCLQFFNDAPDTNRPFTADHAGNGFLMRKGYSVMCLAWQGDVLPGDDRIVIDVPVAEEHGEPISARIRIEFVVDERGVFTLPLSAKFSTRSYPSVLLETAGCELTRRRYPWAAPEAIPPRAWRFARIERDLKEKKPGDSGGGESAVVPSASHIHLDAGFETGWIYELTYTARDPIVLGLGLTAVRDVISFLRYDTTAANPLRQGDVAVRTFYGWGRSQSGRCVREFLHRGFNGDAQGRQVFDGILSHIAGGGKLTLNRFANLVIAASRQYEDALNPADNFPFSYARSVDHITGREDAILRHPETDPFVIHSHTSSEYWNRRGSLVHTDTAGNDLDQPDRVRIYHWASSQHWSDPRLRQPIRGICQNFLNTTATSALFRSLIEAMHAWVRDGKAPPPSRYPRRADGTLKPFDAWKAGFPAIPGVALPMGPNRLPRIDYGKGFDAGREAPLTPEIATGSDYAVLVPATDTDGNEIAGIRMPTITAPLGTFTGWNLRIRGYGHGALHDFSGSYIPLAESAAERMTTGDPRPAILERYGKRENYVGAIEAAARQMVTEGLMLEEDVARQVDSARDWGRARHDIHHLPR